jgi:hypothetical protein
MDKLVKGYIFLNDRRLSDELAIEQKILSKEVDGSKKRLHTERSRIFKDCAKSTTQKDRKTCVLFQLKAWWA